MTDWPAKAEKYRKGQQEIEAASQRQAAEDMGRVEINRKAKMHLFTLRTMIDGSLFEAKVVLLGIPGGVAGEVTIYEVLSQGPESHYTDGDTMIATLDELTPLID